MGAWHKSAVAQVKKLGSAKARLIGEEESLEITRLFQKLSIALMRGNFALLNNRMPMQQDEGELGYILTMPSVPQKKQKLSG